MSGRTCSLRWFQALALPALWIFALSGPKFVLAGERLSAEPSPATSPGPEYVHPEPAETPPKPSKPTLFVPDFKEAIFTVDEAPDSLEEDILEQEVHLDNFFGNPTTETQRRTAYQLRLRNSFHVEQGAKPRFRPSLRANVNLSGITERLRLFFSEDIEPDPSTKRLPEDAGEPGLDRTAQTVRLVNTELRYNMLQSTSADFFMGAGARIVNPPEPFVRSRFQYTHRFSHVALARLAETLVVNNTLGAGATTEASLERTLDPKTLLRWASVATIAKKIEGTEFGSELSLIHDLSPKSAITLTGGIFGNSSLDDVITNYQLVARYRRNVLWDWLKFELDPEISWPRNSNGDFPTRLAVTFVLEFVFQKAAAQKL